MKHKRKILTTLLAVMVVVCSVVIANAANNLTISSTGNVNIKDNSITIDGNVTLSIGTLTVTTGTLTVGGNWANSGSFNAGNGSVVLNGSSQSISGSSTFYNLYKAVTSAATLTLEASKTQTVTNSLTLKGASGNLLSLRSSTGGTQAGLILQNGGSQSLTFLNVKDSNASGGQTLTTANNSTDSGNNTNWTVNVTASTPPLGGGGGGGFSPPTIPLTATSLRLDPGLSGRSLDFKTAVVTVLDQNGAPMEDVEIEASAEGDGDLVNQSKKDRTTGSDGKVTFEFRFPPDAETGQIIFTVDDDITATIGLVKLFSVVKTIDVGNSPRGVGVNPDTNLIYVSHFTGRSVSVIDGNLNNKEDTFEIVVGNKPWGVGVNPNTNRIYVANNGGNRGKTVNVIDGNTNDEKDEKDTFEIAVGKQPRGVGVNPVTNLIYIANWGADTVSVIDGNTNDEKDEKDTFEIAVGKQPGGVGVNPVTNLIYIANWGADTVSVIDGNTNDEEDIIEIKVGSKPMSVGVNPITNRIYVVNWGDDTVSVINGNTNDEKDIIEIKVGNNPWGVGVDTNTNRIYVSNSGGNANGNSVSVIDGATNKVIDTVPVGNKPEGVGVNPETCLIYVANSASKSVSVIQGCSADLDLPPQITSLTVDLGSSERTEDFHEAVVTALDQFGQIMAGVTIIATITGDGELSISGNEVPETSATTGPAGKATFLFRFKNDGTDVNSRIIFTAGGKTVIIKLLEDGEPEINSLTVDPRTSARSADFNEAIVTVLDQNDEPMAGVTITGIAIGGALIEDGDVDVRSMDQVTGDDGTATFRFRFPIVFSGDNVRIIFTASGKTAIITLLKSGDESLPEIKSLTVNPETDVKSLGFKDAIVTVLGKNDEPMAGVTITGTAIGGALIEDGFFNFGPTDKVTGDDGTATFRFTFLFSGDNSRIIFTAGGKTVTIKLLEDGEPEINSLTVDPETEVKSSEFKAAIVTVLDENGEPMVGVTVTANTIDNAFLEDKKFPFDLGPGPIEQVTGADGTVTFMFRFTILGGNIGQIIYTVGDKVATTVLVPGETTTTLPSGFISGNVTDIDSRPVSGIFVDVFEAGSEDFVDSGTTDDNGDYLVNVPAGSYKVGINAVGTNFASVFFDDSPTFGDASVVEVTQDQNAEDIDFVITGGVDVCGTLTDDDGNPLVEATILVFDSATGELLGTGVTNEKGEYCVTIPPGIRDFFIEVFDTTFPLATGVEVTDDGGGGGGGGFTLDFTITIFKIEGVVTDKDILPLTDMFVKLLDPDTKRLVNFDVTDRNGEYLIPLLAGEYDLIVDVAGTNFRPALKEINVVDSDIQESFILLEKNFISGKVTGSNNSPRTDVIVEAFAFDSGFSVGSGVTDSNGDYTIPVSAGQYRVGVNTTGLEFAPTFFNATDWDAALPVTVTDGNDAVGIDFTLSSPGFITGRITDGSNGLNGVLVDVFAFDSGTWVNIGKSGEDGIYSVAVNKGTYKVSANAVEQGFSDSVFNNKTFDTADKVEMVDGETRSGIDFELTRGGSVSGSVRNGGELLSGIEVNAFAFDSDLWIGGAKTVAGDLGSGVGNYRIEGLPVGRYRIWAFDPQKNVISQFYNKTELWSQALSVTTASGAETTDIDFDLSSGGSISGRVTDGTDILKTISVEAYDAVTGLWANSADTDDFGKYTMTLAAGDYRVRAFDHGHIYSSAYYRNAVSFNEALNVTVVKGEEAENISFLLQEAAGFISGEVRDDSNKFIKGIKVNVFDLDTEVWINSATTDVDGKYKIAVAPGRYRVGIIPIDPRFTSAFFENVSAWNQASPVSVTETKDSPNVDFRLLTQGGVITGAVKDNSGRPLPKVDVQVFGFDSNLWVADDISDGDGNFNVKVLAGRYRVWALPLDVTGDIKGEFYDDKENWDLATVVDVAENETVTLNDIGLSTGRAISGKVTTNNGLPLAEVVIDIYEFDTEAWVNSDVTDNDGQYTVHGLHDGDYRVKATPLEVELSGEFFDDARNWDGAKRVKVASANQNNIDFVIPFGGLIAGRVVDEVTDEPIAGIEVDVYDFDKGVWVGHDITDGFGDYFIYVRPGVYLVHTVASGTDFVDKFFDNVTNQGQATPVVVGAEINAVADFRLTGRASITGTIKDVNGNSIAIAEVDVFDDETSFWVNNDRTDSNGGFSVNVPFGRYQIRINGPVGSDFVDQSLEEVVEVTRSGKVAIGSIVLSKGRGSINGIVRNSSNAPLEGIKIKAFDFDSTDLAGIDFTDSSGRYSISVSPGNYIVGAFGVETNTRVVDKYFDGVVTRGSADPISVGKESKTADFVLNTAGACIRGRVRSAEDSMPVIGVSVHVFESDSGLWVNSDKTDANGSYSICVSDGTYRIMTLGNDKFRSQFFNNTVDFDKAKKIVVSGNDVERVDFGLKSNKKQLRD